MSKAKKKFSRPLTVLLSSVCCTAVGLPLLLAEGSAPGVENIAPVPQASPGRAEPAMINLIRRLSARGVLTPADTAELMKLAEADAADARVQAALTALANAQAEAAQTRAEAVALQTSAAKSAPVGANANQTPVVPAVATVASATSPAVAENVPEAVPTETGKSSVPAEPELPDDGTVRVTYVPEVVKAQMREDIKNEVLAQARKERWADPRALPEWVTRFKFFGDIRVRYEGVSFPSENDNTGAFPNFNAINTGAPFDTTGEFFSPQYNVDQNRTRTRLRARLGTAIDLGEGFNAGMRIGSGENNSPVSQNQTIGSAGSGQGGNFSKYALWIDRAFIRYETGTTPEDSLSVTFGRMDNPFFATTLLWADDLGFDGAAMTVPLKIHYDGRVPGKIRPYVVAGAFPIFNTDFNFATNQPDKIASRDKWLYAAQFVVAADLSKDLTLKLGAAHYSFDKVNGRLSTPYTPRNNQEAGDTDHTRPAFAQRGNTYMLLRDIEPDPSINDNGKKNQWQYYGLASEFREVALTGRLDYNRLLPIQISLHGEWVKNNGFNRSKIVPKAVNNWNDADVYGGGDKAWIVGLRIGHITLQKRWDWNIGLAYRNVESDAVIDGFCDSDFGGGGTNVKGFSLNAALALAKRVSLGMRWLSAEEVVGPPLKSDILQIDLNAKF